MRSVTEEQVFSRSLSTGGSSQGISPATQDAIKILQIANYDLIIVETSGIGQGSSAVVDISDLSMCHTPEYGAPSQLEKIDMLDFADFVVLNKFDRRGSEDAFRDIRKQVKKITWNTLTRNSLCMEPLPLSLMIVASMLFILIF